MARIKFGAVVTSGSGSVGGHTVQNSKGGYQLRTKPCFKHKPTFAQSLIRSYNSKLQEGWRLLSDSERNEWNAYARTHSIYNKSNSDHFISGHSLWLKFNFQYISRGLSFISSPFSYSGYFAGSELLVNGDFSSSSSWYYGAQWVWFPSYMFYDATAVAALLQYISIDVGVRFRVSFDISCCSGLASFSLVNGSGLFIFDGDLFSLQSLPNGRHVFYVTCVTASPYFRFLSYSGGSAFRLDNVSLKLLLP